MLCGENGSVGECIRSTRLLRLPLILPDITDFLVEEIKGPAKFTCGDAGCRFEEAAMNQLITDVFGDPYITLNCTSGECLAANQVPGYSVSHFLMQQTHA
jgi:hypothetical protein